MEVVILVKFWGRVGDIFYLSFFIRGVGGFRIFGFFLYSCIIYGEILVLVSLGVIRVVVFFSIFLVFYYNCWEVGVFVGFRRDMRVDKG